MNYFIKRDLNEFGPYTLAELQRYVSTGNVLLTDSCRSDGMTDWMPVSQVIGTIPVTAPVAPTAPVTPVNLYPAPPSLHWGIALLLGVLTCGIFLYVWAFVQALWVRKVEPESKALFFLIAAISSNALTIVAVVGFAGRGTPLVVLARLAGAIFWLVAAFSMKNSIENHYTTAEPIALQLSGVMTFFFNILYFQYHFTQIAKMKEMQSMGQRVGI